MTLQTGNRALGIGLAAAAVLWPLSALSGELASSWVEGTKNQVRLSAGTVPAAGAQPFAFVEIALAKGWKTYWRNPGSAGGIPPEFNWSGSENLASAEVLYPVPDVISDRAGDVIGYKDWVAFPVRLAAKDPSQAIKLALTANFGICEKVCVPVDAALALEIPPSGWPSATPELTAAFDAVPRPDGSQRPGDPAQIAIVQDVKSASPQLTLSARFPGGAGPAEVFVDAVEGAYLPLPARVTAEGDKATFKVDLSGDVDLSQLKGQDVRATFKGPQGQTEHRFRID